MFSYKIDYGIVVAQMDPYVALGTRGIPLKNNAYVSVITIYMYVNSMRLISYHLILFKCTLKKSFYLFSVCREGYTGKNCTLACPFPSYGLNCQSACDCSDEDCNYVTGCRLHARGINIF